MNEGELIKAVLDGDEGARNALVRLHHRRLLATAWHFLGPQDPDAEDMVQETFLAAFKALPRFEGRSSLYTWLNHICVNQCFACVRKRKRLLATESQDLERLLESGAAAARAEAGEKAELAGRKERLAGWMEKIGGRCREILEMRFSQELPLAEIKERLKVPLGTVASRLRRCQERLKAIARRS